MESFVIGCNYWSSKHALYMWRDWDENTIRHDFSLLASRGFNTLRIFPLWPDFQPLTKHYGNRMSLFEYGLRDAPLPDSEAGFCGVDEEMMHRFDRVVSLAEEFGLDLIVGLITGWMSGELFAPPALQGRNLLTDSEAIKWEIRFVKYFVSHYKDCKTITAWDLGNECNNLSKTDNSDDIWLWCSVISDAIRVSDPQKRPVFSGLHGLTVTGPWKIKDQGEICDGLTTHPYPCFVPFCDRDRITGMRPLLHSTCESLLYSQLSGRPCLVEEIGTITGVLAGDTVTSQFVDTTIYSVWANGLAGYMWWCNHDFKSIWRSPYEWNILEKELGLYREDSSPKLFETKIHAFSEFLNTFSLSSLPAAEVDCCLLLGKQDNPSDTWGIGFSAYILAKQAGLNCAFAEMSDPLPDSDLYLLPCVAGFEFFRSSTYEKLMRRVWEGATLYVSLDDPYINGYDDYFGCELLAKYQNPHTAHFSFKDIDFSVPATSSVELRPITAKVLSMDTEGNPCLLQNRYGKGTVYLATVPLERHFANTPNAPEELDAYKIYTLFAKPKTLSSKEKQVCVTKHGDLYVAINYSALAFDAPLTLPECPIEIIKGNPEHMQPFETCIFRLSDEKKGC